MIPRSLRVADRWSRQLKCPLTWSLACIVMVGMGTHSMNDFDTLRQLPPNDLAKLASHFVRDDAPRDWLM